ncbi:MAG: hypothetical protein AAB855_02955 [Patescibacteria group bacterium]|mgnify:CR=1 FL=1
MKERSHQSYSREEAQPSEGEHPERTRKKHRVTQHLENIYQAQRRLETLERPPLPFSEQRLTAGGLAALRMLSGAALAPAGFFLRNIEPHFGSIVAYQGVQLFMKGATHALNRKAPETRGRVEERIGKKKRRKGAAAQEPLSEGALEGKIREVSALTKERQKEFRDYRRAYSATRKAGIIPEESRDQARENYLRGYIGYLDQLIDGQQGALEEEGEQRGLTELAHSLESYHRGIVETHHERADVIGTGLASAVLLGGQHALHGSPMTSETIAALASGIIPLVGASVQRKGKREARVSYVETINREIDELKKHRLAATLKLARLEEKRLQHKEEEKKTEGDETGDIQLSPEEQNEIDDIMAAYRNAVQKLIAPTPSDQQTIGVPSYARTVISPLERDALDGFLGVVIPTEIPSISSAPEHPSRRISPPPFEQIESAHLRREVDKQIIVDVAEIAGRKLHVSSEDTGWLQPMSALDAIREDHDIPDHALDEIVRYLSELNDRLTAHQSVRDFQAFHLADIISARRDIEDELYRRERAHHRELMMYGKPEALRVAILRRSNIATIREDSTNAMTQDIFEEQLRTWVQRKSTRDHDRASLRTFLGALEETLRAITGSMPTKDAKQHIIKRSYDILDEFLPEVSMPDPEQVGIWNRRLEEVTASLKRIQADHSYQPAQRVPERLQIEAFVPSDVMREVTFASADLRDEKIKAVDTKAIVGSYVDREAWVVRDRSRIAELSEPLINDPTPEALQSFFMSEVQRGGRTHLEETIQLLRIPGPKGPLYFTYRGIQHVAAAKVTGLPRVIARVYELRPRDLAGNLFVYTTNKDRYTEWIRLKEAGLIDGDLLTREDLDRFTGIEKIEAKVRHQTVPWLVWFNLEPKAVAPMRSIREVSQLYSALYSPGKGSTETGPFDKLKDAHGAKIDKDLLLSDVELFRRMARRSRAS